MASMTVKQSGKKISCKEGDNLLKVLLAEGIFVDNPCNGKGICGKCKVRILSGQVSAASETEMDQLSAGERYPPVLHGGSAGRCRGRTSEERTQA